MARITRPEVGAPSIDSTQVSATQTGAGATAIGAEVSAVGREFQGSAQLQQAQQVSALIDAEGKRMFAESKASHQSATLLNKTTQATDLFNKQKTARYSQVTDDKGNPTFDTLHEDIGNMGQDVMNQAVESISDPEVADRFRANFSGYVANQKISALKQGRKQQLDFSLSSLDTGLGSLVQSAARDDIDQVASYEQQGIQALRDAVQGGVITQQDFDKKSLEFSGVINEAALQSTIQNNRAKAGEVLQQSPESLGVTPEVKAKLDKELDAENRSDQIAAKKAEELASVDELAEEASLTEDLENRIDADALRESELISVEDQLPKATFSALKSKFINASRARAKQMAEHKDIATAISNNDNLNLKSPAAIDRFHNFLVKQKSDTAGRPIGLSEEARVAASIPTTVKTYAKKLEEAAKFGSIQDAEETIAAFTYLRDRKKNTLDGHFDADATFIMTKAEMLVERAGVSPREAMKQAREILENKDEAVTQFRGRQFSGLANYKDSSIMETAATNLGAETGFFNENSITEEAAITYKELVRDAFVKGATQTEAEAVAKSMMNQTHGFSKVSKESNYMFAPPEKFFPQMEPQLIREVLVAENTPLLPEGVGADSISIESDRTTFGALQVTGIEDGERVTKNIPMWNVTHEVDIDGSTVRVPLIDEKTGEAMIWTPAGANVQELAEQSSQNAVAEAIAQRETNIAKEQQAVRSERDRPSLTDGPKAKVIDRKTAISSNTGIDLIKSFEGKRLEEYKDSVGVSTIGYGHTSTVKSGQKISDAEAESLLKEDLKAFEKGVRTKVKVDLNQNQFDALVSFSFNLGLGSLGKSTLLKKLNKGDYEGAAEEFKKWKNAGGKPSKGLLRRRKAEADLFRKPI